MLRFHRRHREEAILSRDRKTVNMLGWYNTSMFSDRPLRPRETWQFHFDFGGTSSSVGSDTTY